VSRRAGNVAWIGDDQQDLDDRLARWFGKARSDPAQGTPPGHGESRPG
jgi:hypothetical protein